jgi:hypothetical protein
LSSAGWLQRKGTLSLPVLVCSCCFKWVVCAPLAYEVSTTLRLLRAVNFAAKEASILLAPFVQRLRKHDVTAHHIHDQHRARLDVYEDIITADGYFPSFADSLWSMSLGTYELRIGMDLAPEVWRDLPKGNGETKCGNEVSSQK